MTRSQMRLALLTSVMGWRPQLDAASVQAEADVLWAWVEKPAGEAVALLPLVAPMRAETDTGLAQRQRIETVPAEPSAAVVKESLTPAPVEPPPVDTPPPDDRREKLLAAILEAAREGRPCPPDDDLVAVTGYRHKNTVRHGLLQLRKAGVIRIEKPDGAPTASPVRRIRILAEDVVTGWTKDVGRPFALTPHLTRLLAALTAAAEAGAACPTNDELRLACGYCDAPGVSRGVAVLQEQDFIRVELDFGAVRRRRVTIVSTGKATDWTAGRPHRFGQTKAPMAVSTPPEAASPPPAQPEPPPKARKPLPPPPPPARPSLRPDEQAAIDAAVAAGRVTRAPIGKSGIQMRNHRGEVMEVPPPFPDASAWEREAAVYLQQRGATVVTNGARKWLIDGRWSVSGEELVERANKKRVHQKLPPIEIPADAVRARGRAA